MVQVVAMDMDAHGDVPEYHAYNIACIPPGEFDLSCNAIAAALELPHSTIDRAARRVSNMPLDDDGCWILTQAYDE